tara:strand:+ start:17 stop:598 length:582 start_codon:yes stop_codon:yes gene_type:complete
MLKEIFLSSIVSTSLNIESSKDKTKSSDYDFMVKAEKITDDFTFFIETNWERELGEKYRDNVFKFTRVNCNSIYYGFDLISKQSKDIEYLSFITGYEFYDLGLKSGVSVNYSDISKADLLLHLSYNKLLQVNKIDYLFMCALKTDFNENNILELSFDIKAWLTERLNLFLLAKNIYYSRKDDYQIKIGIGFKV